MKITSHTAGGYCPRSSAGTSVLDPLQFKHGTDMHLGGDGWRGHCLPVHAGFPGTTPACLGAPECVSWPTAVKMNQVGLYSGNKRTLVCCGSLCLTRCGEPYQARGQWEHRGQAGVGTAGSGGGHLPEALVCWGGSRNVPCCRSREVRIVGEEFWRVAGNSTALGCLLPKGLALAWARAVGVDKGLSKAVQSKQGNFSRQAVIFLLNVLMCVQSMTQCWPSLVSC